MPYLTDIESNEKENSFVEIGEQKASQKISFQIAQDFYNEITGKSEKLRESFNESFILKLYNIDQLHQQIEQAIEQYNVAAFNCVCLVSFNNNSSQRFSSIERLKLHVESQGAAIESFVIQYNILITLPKTNRPQEYVISIEMISRVAKIENMREGFTQFPVEIPLANLEELSIATFDIEYVDSTVANALMSVLKKWFNVIEKENESKSSKFFKNNRNFMPLITDSILIATVSYCIYVATLKFIPSSGGSLRTAVLLIFFGLLSAYFSLSIGKVLNKKITRCLNNIYALSYIHFSEADTNLVKKSKQLMKRNIMSAIIRVLATAIIGITCSIIANKIT